MLLNVASRTSQAGVVQYAYGIKANMHIRDTHRYTSTFIDDDDPRAPIHAIVNKSGAAMRDHLGIYHNLNTRFEVRTWSWECKLIPLALAVEITTLNFAFKFCTLCACEECWHTTQ